MTPGFSVIYVDPPWWYNNRKTGGERKNKTKFGGGAQKHYPLMPDADLLALGPMIQAIQAPNSACFMWATMPRLDFGIDLLKAWGYRYATTAFAWVKTVKGGQPVYGPGYYTASNAELVLLGISGSMPPVAKMTQSVIHTQRLGHSVKPSLHGLIQGMYPTGRRLEIFSRCAHPEWESIGNELTGRCVSDDLTDLMIEITGRQGSLGL